MCTFMSASRVVSLFTSFSDFRVSYLQTTAPPVLSCVPYRSTTLSSRQQLLHAQVVGERREPTVEPVCVVGVVKDENLFIFTVDFEDMVVPGRFAETEEDGLESEGGAVDALHFVDFGFCHVASDLHGFLVLSGVTRRK
jgi:hypothetical protein